MKKIMNFKVVLLLLCFIASSVFAGDDPKEQKILICGVVKNVQQAVKHTARNIEKLGSHFADYAVIIYENNSTDHTVMRFQKWVKKNPKVTFISENVPENELPKFREEKIARARNIVLSKAKDPKYKDFKYILMVDMDFRTPWPIMEILETIRSPMEWDCVSANGILWNNDTYWDRYAFRNEQYPFGNELLGKEFWTELADQNRDIWFRLKGKDWVPVYSAFGGLAIYKKDSLLSSTYSGSVTEDLRLYYEKIIPMLQKTSEHLQKYVSFMQLDPNPKDGKIPAIFKIEDQDNKVITCEHVPMHATMALKGHGKFYVNPKMIMHYLY